MHCVFRSSTPSQVSICSSPTCCSAHAPSRLALPGQRARVRRGQDTRRSGHCRDPRHRRSSTGQANRARRAAGEGLGSGRQIRCDGRGGARKVRSKCRPGSPVARHRNHGTRADAIEITCDPTPHRLPDARMPDGRHRRFGHRSRRCTTIRPPSFGVIKRPGVHRRHQPRRNRPRPVHLAGGRIPA